MKQLLNTLFVTSEDAYLSLDGENVVEPGKANSCPFSTTYADWNYRILLCRGISCADGSLC